MTKVPDALEHAQELQDLAAIRASLDTLCAAAHLLVSNAAVLEQQLGVMRQKLDDLESRWTRT